ncbi:hypothetical protein [Ferrimicrobium sp.]|uniref:glycosyl-4,4'-diaponeurosporenoate acyltransferase CrtO family protein n=1 Tax=Ferrimicrobium sp. TaxID=2926050 RepID=UPI00262521AD|nr:hypothetical protein [Ferrimicrobium sp.]
MSVSSVTDMALAIAYWITTSVVVGLLGARLTLGALRSVARRTWWSAGPTARWYRRILRIDVWKDKLPEAGRFGGGVSKRRIISRKHSVLERLYLETVRAELVHTVLLAIQWVPVFWLSPGFIAVPVLYALVANVPFIAVQRYNRLRLSRLVSVDDRWSLDE